jgi:hypothetical protein
MIINLKNLNKIFRNGIQECRKSIVYQDEDRFIPGIPIPFLPISKYI